MHAMGRGEPLASCDRRADVTWRVVIVGLVVVMTVCSVSAQSLRVAPVAELPAFEAAVVKPADPSKPVPRIVAPDRVHRPVTTAMELIADAFAIQR